MRGWWKSLVMLLLPVPVLASGVLAAPATVIKETRRPAVRVPATAAEKIPRRPDSFQVRKVEFRQVQVEGRARLAVLIEFNREVDPGSIRHGVNLRVLRHDNGFWVDAFPSGSRYEVTDRFIDWVAGAPIDPGVFKVHLRGTIKDVGGNFLDCNYDGQGEGGNLPAYESETYSGEALLLLPAQ